MKWVIALLCFVQIISPMRAAIYLETWKGIGSFATVTLWMAWQKLKYIWGRLWE